MKSEFSRDEEDEKHETTSLVIYMFSFDEEILGIWILMHSIRLIM